MLDAILDDIYVEYPESHGQNKVYLIESLHSGPQVEKAKVYEDMTNFHEIKNATDEAFVTDRLGELFDPEFIKVVLKVAKPYKCMIEVDEYLGEWTYDGQDFDPSFVNENFTEIQKLPLEEYAQHLARDIPPFELHLGFNLQNWKRTTSFFERSYARMSETRTLQRRMVHFQKSY